MANEIALSSNIRLKNGLLVSQPPAVNRTFDQTTARAADFTADIGTSEETIAFGDVVPGFVRVTNLDDTNFVRLRFTTTDNAIRLRANGGFATFEMDASTSLRAIADTAACKIQVEAFNL
jgi:hypothetical protein